MTPQREPQPTETGPAIDAESDPVEYDPGYEANVIADEVTDYLEGNSPEKLKIKRSDSCDVREPDGNGPKPPADTVQSFLSYALFQVNSWHLKPSDLITKPPFTDRRILFLQQQATNAPTPAGYVRSFFNKQASSSANSYLGLHTFDTYDVAACAALCNAIDICSAFNIYFERDPTVNPGPNCPNPPSFTNVKCTLWGSRLTPETATNTGQYRRDFLVVIAGSDGMLDIKLSSWGSPLPLKYALLVRIEIADIKDLRKNIRLYQKEPPKPSTWI